MVNICMPEDKKKELEAIFTEQCIQCIQFGSIKIFMTLDIVQILCK